MATVRRWQRARGASAALAALLAAAPGRALEPCTPDDFPPYAFLEQGWSAAERERFWFTSQGSRLVPYAWLAALEEAGGEARFCRPERMEALGWLPLPAGSRNPGGLPIGFAMDPPPDAARPREIPPDAWVGFTCAACHTGRIDAGGRRFVVDGGPTLAHFDRFLAELVAALDETRRSAEKGRRMAARIGVREEELRARLEQELPPLVARVRANRPAEGLPADHPGFGRTDAYGQIFNQVLALDLGVEANVHPPRAPASYPCLWGVPFADRVQWNGAARNDARIGHLLRNVTEVIGVFGRVRLRPLVREVPLPVPRLTYDSTVDFAGLGELESLLWTLRAPPWPAEALGAIDRERAARGRQIFERRCLGCHGGGPPAGAAGRAAAVGQGEGFRARMSRLDAIGTDRNEAEQANGRRIRTGSLAARPSFFVVGPLLGLEEPAYKALFHVVLGVILDDPVAAAAAMHRGSRSEVPAPLDPRQAEELILTMVRDALEMRQDDLMPLEYRARTLHGVWATAPYLHNGSVPSLDELLKPQSERVPKFFVGSRSFDPRKVGFESERASGGTELDTGLLGNANIGHEGPAFGTNLDEDERKALIEFLKTL
jgi:mono/diheme cytochrome c family protein